VGYLLEGIQEYPLPFGEADESCVEVIQVRDPHHPLYGLSFQVIRRSIHRGGDFPPSYEVEHRNGASLLVPISATDTPVIKPNRTKLSIEALRELVVAVECLESVNRHPKGDPLSIGIFDARFATVVVTEGKLIQVALQVLLAAALVDANHTALEHAKEAFDGIGGH
jgi:hypothetical protein